MVYSIISSSKKIFSGLMLGLLLMVPAALSGCTPADEVDKQKSYDVNPRHDLPKNAESSQQADEPDTERAHYADSPEAAGTATEKTGPKEQVSQQEAGARQAKQENTTPPAR